MQHKNKSNAKMAQPKSASKSRSSANARDMDNDMEGSYSNDLNEKVEGGPTSSVKMPSTKPMTSQPKSKR
jgi:hypothetical protein